jgi:hypothetical protein
VRYHPITAAVLAAGMLAAGLAVTGCGCQMEPGNPNGCGINTPPSPSPAPATPAAIGNETSGAPCPQSDAGLNSANGLICQWSNTSPTENAWTVQP